MVVLRFLLDSLTRVDFYADLRSKKGYGILGLFNAIYVSSIVICVVFFYQFIQVTDFFLFGNKNSTVAHKLEYVLEQWPTDLTYDGKKIAIPEPVVIYTQAGTPLIAIDPNHKLTSSEHNRALVFMDKERLFVDIKKSDAFYNNLSIRYNEFIPSAYHKTINREDVVNMCSVVMQNANRTFIYIFVPTYILLRFMSSLFTRGLLVAIFFFVDSVFRPEKSQPTRVADILRLVCAASYAPILLEPLSLIDQKLSIISLMVQFWTNSLLLISIYQRHNKQKNEPL